MNTEMTISAYRLLKAPTLAAFVEKPPVPAVPKAWSSASKKLSPPAFRKMVSKAVRAIYIR